MEMRVDGSHPRMWFGPHPGPWLVWPGCVLRDEASEGVAREKSWILELLRIFTACSKMRPVGKPGR